MDPNTFDYTGHTFKQWKLEGGTTTYKDRANIVASGPLTLIAEWYDKEQPAAPSAVKVSNSILNYGNDSLENQAGEITGGNTNMQVYTGNGEWTTITAAPYTVTEPGTYEIRVKEIPPYPPSAAKSVTVHSYYTEASEPIGPKTYDEKTAYQYTVKLKENTEDGQVVEVHHTNLYEPVKFMLTYPSGINGTQYSFKLYHLPDMVEITDYTATSSGIIASAKEFSDFLLVIENNVTITFKGNNGSTSAGRTEYIQYVPPGKQTALEENKFTYSHYIFTGWNTSEDGDGTPYNEEEQVTLSDNGLVLYAQWLGPVTINGSSSGDGVVAYVGETLTASVTNNKDESSLKYQWVYWGTGKKPDGTPAEGWVSITGENKKTYVPSETYNGKRITCRVTKNNNSAFGNEKTLKDSLDSVYWGMDFINDGDTTKYPNAQYHTIPGYIEGVVEGMEYSLNGGSTWTKITASQISDGKFLVPGIGTYIIRQGGVKSDPITIYNWYVVGYTVSSSSSAGGTARMTASNSSASNGAMPSSPVLADSTQSQRDNNTIMKLASNWDNLWAVRSDNSRSIALTVQPSGSTSYAHVSLNGSTIDSFGGSKSSSTSSSGSTSRTYAVTPVNQPKIYSIVFNNSSTSPGTGDVSHLGLWSALCLVSLTGAATILGKTFKRRKSK